MTYEEMMAMIEGLGADAEMMILDKEEMVLDVTLQDFEGFDDDWSEIYRDYDHPEAVEQFEDMLDTACLSREGDYYVRYHFDGFTVRLGYASYDI